VTYLDGDLFFFDSPEAIFDELDDAAFAIIPHRYTAAIQHLRRYGVYNVGWVGARNEPDGLAAVKWWRERCIEWCYDHVDGERFADQRYLDGLAARFPRVKAIANLGANLAPWNIGNYRVAFREDKVLIDQAYPLIFFHFQGLKKEMGYSSSTAIASIARRFPGSFAIISMGPMSRNCLRSNEGWVRPWTLPTPVRSGARRSTPPAAA